MGLKKYEIITVGGNKRVRALRSWQVGGRYVNIGDVGGIVYDEKTLSQDGLCWLFKGNFGFPGARIGGDSIVDVAETTLSAAGAPNVDILGSSVVVGSKLVFEAEQTTADAVVLGEADFEQGDYTFMVGAKAENQKVNAPMVVRTKSPIFMGGVSKTLKLNVPGYAVQAFGLDADLVIVSATATTVTGAGATLVVPAARYCLIRLRKDPVAATVPADATTAKIKFTGTYETKLSIIDSRVEINPATSTGTVTIKPGGFYIMSPGASYPNSVIRNSKVVINGHATANRVVRLISEFIGCNVVIDATAAGSQGAGVYSNVKNLTFTGLPVATGNVAAHSIIQATDCDNFAVSPTVFPGLAAAQTANEPFIFQGCNVPNGIFYHHAQIANTYKNIDFALAQADLGKTLGGNRELASSEVEGMYRVYSTTGSVFGALVESYDSVKSLSMAGTVGSYGTTIYKDAYLNGRFDFAGTNVFGNTRKHDTQDVSGCKIVNTGATAVNMKGNIRVEDNATLTNVSITGTGYFGGNSVVSYTPAVWAALEANGSLFMKDNAVFAPTALKGACTLVHMEGNAKFIGSVSTSSTNLSFTMRDNAVIEGKANTRSGVVMSGNSKVTATGQIMSDSRGTLVMKDNASIEADTTVIGAITLAGNYKGNVVKTWTGNRTITDVNAPEYDNNVKTQYDF